MTVQEARRLKPGDTVWWTDRYRERLARALTIATITVDRRITLVDTAGETWVCRPRDLALQRRASEERSAQAAAATRLVAQLASVCPFIVKPVLLRVGRTPPRSFGGGLLDSLGPALPSCLLVCGERDAVAGRPPRILVSAIHRWQVGDPPALLRLPSDLDAVCFVACSTPPKECKTWTLDILNLAQLPSPAW